MRPSVFLAETYSAMPVRRSLFIWLLCCLVAGAVFVVYVLASLAAGRGEFVLPLDDVYIHFQYARQMASGQPYVYNPGQPPTSGATSFIYPYVLALGYLLGFQALRLSLWAMIVGALALAGSLWLVYRLLKAYDAPDWLAVLTALIFGLTGAVNWHFMSGMETGLMTLFTLATLYAVVTQSVAGFAISASLLALVRPEGGALALIGAGAMLVQAWAAREARVQRSRWWLLLVPVLAIFVQPVVNLLVTGSAVATGNSAKSILGSVPFYWDEALRRILENFLRMWGEFITGASPREGLYLPYLVGPLALVFLVGGLVRRRYRIVNSMLILWLLAGTAAVATLDTAFWHFKRYQMPLMAMLFPVAGWALNHVLVTLRARRAALLRYAVAGLMAAGLAVALLIGAAFVGHFALNVNYVYLQPLQMARWLKAHTPQDAVVAVHDVGMMRYMGERTTLDMVGLTTPGAAAYWRNGPGSIAEFLIQERPDYIASYGRGHGLGLELIANTRIYGDPLAEFPADPHPNYNVALAADYQGIYQPDWEQIVQAWDEYENAASITMINVSNLESEAQVQYFWRDHDRLPGFPTDIQELIIPNCPIEPCTLLDGMRRISGAESFVLSPQAAQPIYLLTFVHPGSHGTLDIYANDQFMSRRWIPDMPGWIISIPTTIPSEFVTGESLTIRIEPTVADGYYMPLRHLAIQADFDPEPPPGQPLATYQNGALELSEIWQRINRNQALELSLYWYSDGSAEGDYRFFVHLYDDINQPPVAQMDRYPLIPPSPPGNWLPGPHPDSVVVDLNDVPPGTYKLAIGFYNPYTGERLMPESDVYEISADGRLFLEEIEIPASPE